MTQTQLKWWHVRWKRPAFVLLYVMVACIFLFEIVDFVTSWLAPVYMVHSLTKDDPIANLIPVPMRDSSDSALDGPRVNSMGISLQLPSQNIDKGRNWKSNAAYSFKNGGHLLLLDRSAESQLNVSIRKAPEMQFLGKDAITTEFGFIRAEMYTRPGEVVWWKSPARNRRASFLLLQKGIELSGHGPIYEIHLGELKGFQLGDPQDAKNSTTLILFDPSDRAIKLIFDTDANASHPAWTQSQINAVVASIRPATIQSDCAK